MGAGTELRDRADGLAWIQKTFSLVPQWTVEPDSEAVKEVVTALDLFRLPSTGSIHVSYLTAGAFNRVYIIRAGEDQDELIMQVSLPVEPKWKTLSEVATVEWVRLNTSLPVPRILAREASRDNLLGFEWILKSKVPGITLEDAWRSMKFSAIKRLVQQVAIFASSCFKKQLRGIRNIYAVSGVNPKSQDDGDTDLPPAVERIVSMKFFWGDRSWHTVSRGPFRSSKAWLEALLSLVEQDHQRTLSTYAETESLTEVDRRKVLGARTVLGVVSRLKSLILNTLNFSPWESCTGENEAEPSMLFHDDLNMQNILVDEAGALAGVIDWECVSALPLWKACDYPIFLIEAALHHKPIKARFHHDEVSQEMYWEHMQRYEPTKLRQYFLDEMQKLEPGWMKVFAASKLLRDLEVVLAFCDDATYTGMINRWIDGVIGKSEPFSFYEYAFED